MAVSGDSRGMASAPTRLALQSPPRKLTACLPIGAPRSVPREAPPEPASGVWAGRPGRGSSRSRGGSVDHRRDPRLAGVSGCAGTIGLHPAGTDRGCHSHRTDRGVGALRRRQHLRERALLRLGARVAMGRLSGTRRRLSLSSSRSTRTTVGIHRGHRAGSPRPFPLTVRFRSPRRSPNRGRMCCG